MQEGNAAEALAEERDWLFRAYDPNDPEDESGMMYLLGVGYARGKAGWRAGASGAGEARGGLTTGSEVASNHDALAKQKAFLDSHAPIWRWLLANANVTLAVDPLDLSNIWGWIISSEPDVVHAIGVKRSVIKAGLGRDLVRDLAGSRWSEHQVVTLELPQLRSATSKYKSSHLVDLDRPYQWSLDPTWLVTRMIRR